MADLLEELYRKYDKLSQATDFSELSNEYLESIEGTQAGSSEKKLAAQILSQYFKHFPALQDQALNAIFNLCEDSESDIRMFAMKVLPHICKDSKIHVLNIASILSQLLQLEDHDYTVACNSLTDVFKLHQVTTARGILTNINSSENSAEDEGPDAQERAQEVREKCIKFLYTKLAKTIKLLPECQDLLIEEGKKIVQECTASEFMVIMPYLMKSKLIKTLAGQKELVDIVAERIELNSKFDPLEEGTNNTDRLILCVNSIMPLFVTVDSSKFLNYYCNQVLPQWEAIATLEEGKKLQALLLRQIAELSAHCSTNENISEIVEKIFEKLKEYMPLPPENVDVNEIPHLDYSNVECLLYAFHKLARKCPEFLTEDQERLKDFRARLLYFSRGVQGAKRGLEKSKSTQEEQNKEDLEKLKLAPVVLENINTIIKDLFHQTPIYKCNVQLSFKSQNKKIEIVADKSPNAQKRHVPITFDSSNGAAAKQARSNKSGEDRKLYQPPSGKFSSNFGRTTTRGSWSRGGGGRGQRGSRGSRNWRN